MATGTTDDAEKQRLFEELIRALSAFRDLWYTCTDDANLPKASGSRLNAEYEKIDWGTSKYATDRYPSLFSDLPILNGERGLSAAGLPQDWPPDDIAERLQRNPLAKLLVAFIWKQRDYLKVKRMLAGLLNPDEMPTEEPVVLHQFGRHLANPLEYPIFDQHTNRAYRLLRWTCPDETSAEDRSSFITARTKDERNMLRGKTGPKSPDLKEYLAWWNTDIKSRLPPPESDRAEAILWTDRWLYSIGKLAKRVFK